MEQLDFAGRYSFKNITTPRNLEFMKQLVISIEKVLHRMRYRAYFYLKIGEGETNENHKHSMDEEECREDSKFKKLFKSGAKPPFIKEMEDY